MRKIADFNSDRFTLRCLGASIILVSAKLKNTMRTSERFEIIRNAERQLLTQGVRSTSNTIKLTRIKRNTYRNQLVFWTRYL